MVKNNDKGIEHQASARFLNIPVSTKQSIEIAKAIRYKSTGYAKQFLEEVVALKKAVEFRTFKRNVGHKVGMASGRFPQKAARQFIKLVNSAEANAQFKGLNVDDLKIVKLTANLASIPLRGGRQRHKTKRTHLEIVVKERTPSKKSKGKKQVISSEPVAATVTAPIESSTKVHAETIAAKKEDLILKATPKIEKKSVSSQGGSGSIEVSSHPSAFPRKEAKEIKSEPTSQDLLRKAQARAAELNKQAADKKAVDQVSQLYSDLSKKGTLREGNSSATTATVKQK
ncbi:50S ribosomal protein L22 [Candidatus Woesearchaeota archaeon]|nr:50S ribosomal protein L22 [Candidatus Woesearchaeota archaeon]